MTPRPWRKTGIDKVCKCGTTFYCPGWSMKRKKYCSVKCRCDFHPTGAKYSDEARAKISKAKKGLKLSEEQKKQIGDFWRGKKFSKERKEKMRLNAKRGKDNPAWKGGVTSANKIARHSYQYKDWRTAVFERDNFTCVGCGDRGVYLHADHIMPFAFYPELRTELSNGRTLCVPCHESTPTYKCHKNIYAP